MNLNSALVGITAPLNSLYEQLAAAGWQPSGVKWDKKAGAYVAEAKNQWGEKIIKIGPDEKTAVAALLMATHRKNHIRTQAQWKVGMWQTTFTDRLQEIAEAYAKAPVYEPKAAQAFRALADDSVARVKVLQGYLNVEVVDDPEPYPDVQKMIEDIHKKKHLLVSRANNEHPVWTVDEVVAFRTVHDVLGHAVAGSGFDWAGENRACAAHFPLLGELAQQALFSESIAPAAYAAYYRSFGPRKIALFPKLVEGPQTDENSGGHAGVHPSQSVPPGAVPGLPEDEPAPTSLNPVVSAAETLADPNHKWDSGIEPIEPNAYLHHGDPFQVQAVMENAEKINTDWSDNPNPDVMKQAILNAFRAVLLSPRKNLQWNAIHYQDISHMPGSVDDPKAYWDTLENARQNWNVKRFGEKARYDHLPWKKYMPELRSLVLNSHPDQDYRTVTETVNRMIFDWQMEEASKLEDEDPEHKKDFNVIEKEVREVVEKRIKNLIKEHKPDLDHYGAKRKKAPIRKKPVDPGDTIGMGLDDPVVDIKSDKPAKYGAFMSSHLKAIASLGRHVDEILKAAIEDVKDHDGTGHHFRSAVLQLGISGVGPKVCSFAWLLLQPLTSQLATIDTHMLDVLGSTEKEMNNRDYFRFERELQAGRNASGYSHVPLGAFQWGMWDLKRTGEGSHQDHSALKVLDPLPHDQIDWAKKAPDVNLKGDEWKRAAPDWWMATEDARQHVRDQWQAGPEQAVPNNRFPFQRLAKPFKVVYAERSFKYWWDKQMPVGGKIITKGELLADYAVATHTTRSELKAFAKAHRHQSGLSDTAWTRFHAALLKRFDKLPDFQKKKDKESKVIESTTVPRIHFEDADHDGIPDQSIMDHAVKTLHLTTPEIWKLLKDEDVSHQDVAAISSS